MNPVTPKDVLGYSKMKKVWFIGERELAKGEVDNLKADAGLIVNTKLWKMVILQSKYYAQVRAIGEAKTLEDMTRAQEYHRAVQTIETFVNNLLK